jgi:hypothetical protein
MPRYNLYEVEGNVWTGYSIIRKSTGEVIHMGVKSYTTALLMSQKMTNGHFFRDEKEYVSSGR